MIVNEELKVLVKVFWMEGRTYRQGSSRWGTLSASAVGSTVDVGDAVGYGEMDA